MTYVEDKILEWYDSDVAVQEELDSVSAVTASKGEAPATVDITLLSQELKSKAKAHVHKDTIQLGEFTKNGVTINIISVNVENDDLAVVLTAYDVNGVLPSAIRNKHLFRNAPTMVRLDEETVEDDPVTVSKDFIYESVVSYARNHGWNG